MSKGLLAGATLALVLADGGIPHQAVANDVGFRLIETSAYAGGPETLTAEWSSDPAAVFGISGTADNWTISLLGSGHRTLSVSGYFDAGYTFSWAEPDDPTTYNTLAKIDADTWKLVSETSTLGTFNTTFGVHAYGNGAGTVAGVDSNGDAVYVSVTERVVPEPASLALLGVAVAGVGVVRRKRA